MKSAQVRSPVMLLVSGSDFSCRDRSSPLVSGSSMSGTTRRGRRRRATSTASAPVRASALSKPALASIRVSA